MASNENASDEPSFLSETLTEIFTQPLNLFLVVVIAILVYLIFKKNRQENSVYVQPEPTLPKLKRRDFKLEELQKYDGNGEDGRILIGINGKVFDVTKGRRFYGPGGPYAAFAGRDASRSFATFSVGPTKNTYDDLSDLNSMQMDSMKEWEMQFTERYDYVGKLLKPGQEPTNYSEEEDEDGSQQDQSVKTEEVSNQKKDQFNEIKVGDVAKESSKPKEE